MILRLKIIGMIPVYNEDDIIEEVINHYLNQGIELVILDNGSTDNTFEICKKYEGKGVIKLLQFETDSFKVSLIKEMLYHMAIEQSPDWIVLSDADEFLEPTEQNKTLQSVILEVDKAGYNLIQFDKFEFFMTEKDTSDVVDGIKNKMQYYSNVGDYVYRAWKYFPGIRIGDTAGHFPIYPEEYQYKIFDKKFVLRHFPYRNEKQAKKKVYAVTRGPKDLKKEKVLMSAHNKKIAKIDFSKKVSYAKLTKYNNDGIWNYNIKHIPYITTNPLKRNEIFTDDGYLREPFPTAYEMKLMLDERLSKTLAIRAFRKIKRKTKF